MTAAANLDGIRTTRLRQLRYDEKPYWDIERARIGRSREVPVEVIVNGERAAVQNLTADGKDPDADLRRSGRAQQLDRRARAAVRPHQSGLRHGWRKTGPRLEAQRRVVPQRGQPVLDAEGAQITAAELDAARAAYDHAREVYRQRRGGWNRR